MRVLVLYNWVDEVSKGSEVDKIAVNEVKDTSESIKRVLEKKGHVVTTEAVEKADLSNLKERCDFVFNLAEGYGDDNLAEAKIAEDIRKSGVPFSGSPPESLALCVHKDKVKEVMASNGIGTAKYQVMRPGDKLGDGLRFPLIVKPLHEDGSAGITKESYVRNEDELQFKLKDIYDNFGKQKSLVEEYIDGQEFNVPLIGNGDDFTVLPISEIDFSAYPPDVPRIETYESKWVEGTFTFDNTKPKIPAKISKELEEELIDVSKKAFALCKCADYARMEFRVRKGMGKDGQENPEVFLIEVNPNPCLTEWEGRLYMSALAVPMTYDEMIMLIFDASLKRQGVRAKQ
ncbi:hypothetical protein JW711_04490 [Candidatus Woesearchaeota archaeon]|nr:hypothetical protein [Candidatus Woesearchaeota archaeon]